MSLFLALALVGQFPGGIEADPRLSWYTYETGHFAVHFASPGRPAPEACSLARHVALLAEDVHSCLCPATGPAPRGRTNVIINDSEDRSGGWATPFPDNTITIHPSAVPGDKTNYDDWLRTLLVHEYTHIVQLNRTRGLPRALGRVFGRIDLVNTFLPTWLIEGYASAAESRFTPFGALRGAEYDMMLRSQAYRPLPIDRWSTYELGRYPTVLAPYVYGSSFMRRLADDFSAWDSFSAAQSGTVPFFEELNAKRVFGRTFAAAEADWRRWLVARAASVRAGLGPVTDPTRLTREGYFTSSPCWSRDGRELYYISRTGKEYPAIKALDLTTGGTRVLHQGPVSGQMSVSPDGRWLAFGQTVAETYHGYSDVFLFGLVGQGVKRLTVRARASDPCFSPDSVSLVYVARHAGQSGLVRLDLASGAVESLTSTADYSSYHGPRFSPDGRLLAVGVNRPGGYSDVEVVDTRTGWRVPVTEDRANDLSPEWSRTGRTLFFVSDRTGIYNLYAWSVATQETKRCTNFELGGFEPRVAPDNRSIALLTHTADGYDLATIPLDARTWTDAPPFADTLPESEPAPPSPEPVLYYYNPSPTVWPKFWLPYVGWDQGLELGAMTLGWDALRTHQYSLALAHRLRGTPFLAASYTFTKSRVVPALELELTPAVQDAGLGLSMPFRADRRATSLNLAALARHDSSFAASYSLGCATSTALMYRYAVAPVEGYQAGIRTGLEARELGSARDQARFIGYWYQYLGAPPRNWSLRLALAAGTGTTDSSWTLGTGTGLTGVRGFSTGSLPGRNVLLAKAQFRTPLWWPERGLSTLPVFLRDVNAAAFADCGMAWTRADEVRPRFGVGAELGADLILGYLLPVSVTAGCAYGDALQLYAGVSADYLSGLLSGNPLEKEPAGR